MAPVRAAVGPDPVPNATASLDKDSTNVLAGTDRIFRFTVVNPAPPTPNPGPLPVSATSASKSITRTDAHCGVIPSNIFGSTVNDLLDSEPCPTDPGVIPPPPTPPCTTPTACQAIVQQQINAAVAAVSQASGCDLTGDLTTCVTSKIPSGAPCSTPAECQAVAEQTVADAQTAVGDATGCDPSGSDVPQCVTNRLPCAFPDECVQALETAVDEQIQALLSQLPCDPSSNDPGTGCVPGGLPCGTAADCVATVEQAVGSQLAAIETTLGCDPQQGPEACATSKIPPDTIPCDPQSDPASCVPSVGPLPCPNPNDATTCVTDHIPPDTLPCNPQSDPKACVPDVGPPPCDPNMANDCQDKALQAAQGLLQMIEDKLGCDPTQSAVSCDPNGNPLPCDPQATEPNDCATYLAQQIQQTITPIFTMLGCTQDAPQDCVPTINPGQLIPCFDPQSCVVFLNEVVQFLKNLVAYLQTYPCKADDIKAPPAPNPSSPLPLHGVNAPECYGMINFVKITPPASITLDGGMGVQGNWLFFPVGQSMVFEGGPLAPGQTMDFAIGGSARHKTIVNGHSILVPPDHDIPTNLWQVGTSTDSGDTIRQATSTSNGLNTAIHVLEVSSCDVAGPARPDWNTTTPDPATVTTGTSYGDVECTVLNASHINQSIAVNLGNVASYDTTTAGGITAGAFDTVAGDGGQKTVTMHHVKYDFDPSTADIAGKARSIVVVGGVSTLADTAKQYDLAVTRQTPCDWDATATLNKTDMVPNKDYSFKATVHKTGAVECRGVANIAFSDANGPILDGNGDPLTATADVTFPRGDADQAISFQMHLPDVGKDTIGATIAIKTIDENSVLASKTGILTGKVTTDPTLPHIDSKIKLKAPVIVGATPAAKNNVDVTVEGTITRIGDHPCGTCTLSGTQFVESGGTNTFNPIPVTCGAVGADGTFSCTYNGSFDPGATSMYFHATASTDPDGQTPGQSSSDDSKAVDVDNDAPMVDAKASHTFSDFNGSHIDLLLTDAGQIVDGKVNPNNFRVSDAQGKLLVVSAARILRPLTLQLDFALPFDGDLIAGVRYDAACSNAQLAGTTLCTHVYDRVGNELKSGQTYTIADGVAPVAPVLSLVDGDAGDAQDGRGIDGPRVFYTKNPQAAFTVTNAEANDFLTVVVDDGSHNPFKSGLTKIVDKAAIACDASSAPALPGAAPIAIAPSACTATVHTVNPLPETTNPAQPWLVYAYYTDAAGNVGPVSTYRFVSDRTNPVIDHWQINYSGGPIVVSLNENVIGTDADADWTVTVQKGEDVRTLQATVDRFGGTLVLYPQTPYDPTWTVLGVQYAYTLQLNDASHLRYRDRAGNTMADQCSGTCL